MLESVEARRPGEDVFLDEVNRKEYVPKIQHSEISGVVDLLGHSKETLYVYHCTQETYI